MVRQDSKDDTNEEREERSVGSQCEMTLLNITIKGVKGAWRTDLVATR
jgi:hypothetical protein